MFISKLHTSFLSINSLNCIKLANDCSQFCVKISDDNLPQRQSAMCLSLVGTFNYRCFKI